GQSIPRHLAIQCGLCFCFDKIRCPVRMGRFRLILSDANYPNYKLKEGVFRIWLNTPQQQAPTV
ncbi:MAG TPA: hypothetical protein PLM59_08335, partial [Oscillospiraceae bacterium]|nr:hypothetical protein [Oscillospiraceae bacterium]